MTTAWLSQGWEKPAVKVEIPYSAKAINRRFLRAFLNISSRVGQTVCE
ncbi:hypothetical protein [Paraburkholderia sp. RL17-347-BIC-D]